MKLTRTNKRPIKIMQFGEGNFLRAFVDYFIQVLNDKHLFHGDVVVVQPIHFGRVKELKEAEGLYTLFLEGIVDNKPYQTHQVIDVLSDFINPYEQLDDYLAYAHSETLAYIVSNTTEAGIVYVEETLSNQVTPKSFPGKLLLFLHERYHAFKDKKANGLEIYALELIDNNADTLKAILEKLARYNNYSQDFINWLLTENIFYNTLVDRIVPGFPKNFDEITKQLGYVDHNIVKGEVFHLWVINQVDGYTSALEKAFAQSGLDVYYVDDITPYKERKVKILNGSHTAMVPIAYMLGHEAVKESMEDALVERFIKGFIFDEVIHTIALPEADMIRFSNSVFDRYKNPYIHHLLLSIALNSLSKYKSRILPTLIDATKQGIFPRHALFALAALIYFYQGVDEQGNTIPLNDDEQLINHFKTMNQKDNKIIVMQTLQWAFWDTDVFSPKMMEFVYTYFNIMQTKGMKKALEAFYE